LRDPYFVRVKKYLLKNVNYSSRFCLV